MLLPLFDLNPISRLPLLTVLIILANLVIHWRIEQMPEQQRVAVYDEYGAVPARLSAIGQGKPADLAIPVYGRNNNGEIVQVGVRKATLSTDYGSVLLTLLTMMFLHGSWLHVASNMWALWIFGNNIEDRLGHLIFLGYYLLGGVLAMACQWVFDPGATQPVVGASGALWAALGGYAVTWPKAKVKSLLFVGFPFLLNVPALIVIGYFFVIDLVAGFAMLHGEAVQQVAHWAHIGGCVSGVLMMPLLSLGASPADADWRSETAELMTPSTVER